MHYILFLKDKLYSRLIRISTSSFITGGELPKHIDATASIDDQKKDYPKDELSLSVLPHVYDWNTDRGPN